MITKSMIRRLKKTHPNRQWCQTCEGEGVVSYSATNHSFCPDCHGNGTVEKDLE